MTTYCTTKTTLAEIENLQQTYLQQQTAPLDGMWQSFVSMAQTSAIVCNKKTVGYISINAEQKLLQFYLEPGHNSRQIFEQLLCEQKITGAFVATCGAHYLSLCLDRQISTKVHALMYKFEDHQPLQNEDFSPETEFRLAIAQDLPNIVDFGTQNLGADPVWLTNYYTGLLERKELFALWLHNSLLALGECRPSAAQHPYADVGMVVGSTHRGQGIATNILRRLVAICRHRGWSAICSTEQDNIAAQKAIEKTGFVSHHRILYTQF